MADMLEWGANWLKGMVGLHAVQDISVRCDGTWIETTASLVDEAGRIIPGQVALVTEHTKFMFETTQVASKGIVFKRNTIVRWGAQDYQVVLQGGAWWTYNDVFKQHIVVNTKHVSDSNS